MQMKDVWKHTEERIERLKGVYFRARRGKCTTWKEDELGCEWEIVLEWKWEVCTRRG